MIPIQTALSLGFRSFGFGGFGLTPFSGSLILLGVMRMGLFVILAARATEKEQDRLSVGTAHTVSFRNWRVVVKRNFICPTWASVARLTPTLPFKYGPTYV
ncbi:MAG TPA: hypothetical protein VNF28_01990 [Candidatus Binataceae bacterium]|nr:hypothetical protein [Candidatus Binataceae bacterium]